MIPCKISMCNDTFSTVFQYFSHLKDMHTGKKLNLPCSDDNCALVFNNVETFRKHMFFYHKTLYYSDASKAQPVRNVEPLIECDEDDDHSVHGDDIIDGERPNPEKMYNNLIVQIERKFNVLNLNLEYKYDVPLCHAPCILSDVRDLLSLLKLEFSCCLLTRIGQIGTLSDPLLEFMLEDSISLEDALKITKGTEGAVLKEMGYIAPVEYHFDTDSDSDSENSREPSDESECGDNGNLSGTGESSDESSGSSSEDDVVIDVDRSELRCKTWQYVPILDSMRQYMSCESVRTSMQKEQVRPGILDKFNAGSMMSTHKIFKRDRTALRPIIYTDEFTVSTRIGEHQKRQKYLGVYGSLNNIESRFAAAKESLFLVMLVNYNLIIKHGYVPILRPLINDLKTLETKGLTWTDKGEKCHMNGGLGPVLGDNKSQHYIGGYSQCFRYGAACRRCMTHCKDMASVHSECQCVLRTVESHGIHVEAVSQDPKLSTVYGVKEKPVFEELESYHPIDSLVQDLLHDVEEGFIPKNIVATVRGLVKNNVVSLETINAKLANFPYSILDRTNILKKLPETVTSSKKKLSGTGAEKRNLFHMFTILIGPLVPVDNEYWALHLLANQICSILFAPSVKREWLPQLKHLVKQHHQLWTSLPADVVGSFTCKLHYIVHSAAWIEAIGPLRHLDCKKFERFHQFLKWISLKSNNYINPALTMAEKFQKKRCIQFAGQSPCELTYEIGAQKVQYLSRLSNTERDVVSNYFSADQPTAVSMASQLILTGHKFKPGFYVVVDVVEDVPVFMKVLKIYGFKGKWCLYGRLTYVSNWNDHMFAYAIDTDVNSDDDLVCISPNDCIPPQTLAAYEMAVVYEYMVSFKVYNKIIKVTEKSFSAIIGAYNSKLDAAEKTAKEKVIFRVYSEKYKRYTDCDVESDLPDDGILEIIEKPKQVEPARAESGKNGGEDEDDDSGNEEEQDDQEQGNGEGGNNGNNSSRDDGNSNESSDNEIQIPSLVGKPKAFPRAYRLPKNLPPKVVMVLTRGKTNEERISSQKIVRDSRKLRNALMRRIKTQLDRYTDYPNGALVTVVTTLIQKYPGLADEVPHCADSKLSYIRHKTMLSCLKNKFKYTRKTEEEPTPLMLAIRKKYGRKGKAQLDAETVEGNVTAVADPSDDPAEADSVEETAAPRKTVEREHLKLPPNAGVGETDGTYQKHAEFIFKSWNSRSPDMEGISSRMDKSILYRLEYYDQGPEKLLATFPNLENADQILQDAKRYFGFDFSDRRAKFFSDETIKFFFMKVSKIPTVYKNQIVPDENASLSQKLDFILKNFHHLCNETSKVVKPYRQNKVGVHPCICFETIDEELVYKVFLDRKLVCSNAPDLPTAVDVLMAIIYLFNVSFVNRSKRTLRFLAEEFYCIPFMTVKAQSAVTLMNQLASHRLASEGGQSADENEEMGS